MIFIYLFIYFIIIIIFYYFRLFKPVSVKTDLEDFDFIGEVILSDCTEEFAYYLSLFYMVQFHFVHALELR